MRKDKIFDKRRCVYNKPAQKSFNINVLFLFLQFYPPSRFLMTLDLVFFWQNSTPCFVFRAMMKDPPPTPRLSDPRLSRSAFWQRKSFELLWCVFLRVQNGCVTSWLSVLVLITVLLARGLFVSDRFFCVCGGSGAFGVFCCESGSAVSSLSSHLSLTTAKISICRVFLRTDFLYRITTSVFSHFHRPYVWFSAYREPLWFLLLLLFAVCFLLCFMKRLRDPRRANNVKEVWGLRSFRLGNAWRKSRRE